MWWLPSTAEVQKCQTGRYDFDLETEVKVQDHEISIGIAVLRLAQSVGGLLINLATLQLLNIALYLRAYFYVRRTFYRVSTYVLFSRNEAVASPAVFVIVS